MSSINSGIDFIFNSKSSDEYGVFLCTSFGSVTRANNTENRTIITTKNIYNKRFNLHGVQYDSPLTFDIIIANNDGTYIDTYKERELKKWLLCSTRHWLQINQIDHIDVSYYCIATKSEIIDVGAYSGGMLISFECDVPWAWSGINKKSYTSNTTYTFNFNLITDYDEYILSPMVTIKPTSDGNISIKNNTTNKTATIDNCVTTETIIMDGNKDIIESSNNRVLLDSWNKQFLELISGSNNITLTGNFTMILEYRLPIRIGG